MTSEATRWQEWDVDKVCEKLRELKFSEQIVKNFRVGNVSVNKLKYFTEDYMLEKMGMTTMDERFQFQKMLLDIGCSMQKKIINDPIHGPMEFHPACIAITDTPQFQRLCFIKQLGTAEYVYPAASHSRFEHCLGVCYLAGKFARSLKDNQKNLGITEKDILCVEIAGLCHDLGHGPYSHLFERFVYPYQPKDKKWKHEEITVKMFDHLIKENGLMLEDGILTLYGLDETDLQFVREQIDPAIEDGQPWKCKGREENKAFLYEIVANKRNNVDVDKWDYFARDCHNLGIKSNFDHTRFIKFARVCGKGEERKKICIRDKEIGNLANMFLTRYTLHKFACQHNVCCGIDLMIIDALSIAKEHIRITVPKKGEKAKKKSTIAESLEDMDVYTYLTDDIIFKIQDFDGEEEGMEEAKTIIGRIFTRQLYRCVGESRPLTKEDSAKIPMNKIKEEIMEKLKASSDDIEEYSFKIQTAFFDFGMKDDNPLDHVYVFSKNNPDEAVRYSELKRKDSKILEPLVFSEKRIRVYSCDTDRDKQSKISKAFDEWCEDKGFKCDDRERTSRMPNRNDSGKTPVEVKSQQQIATQQPETSRKK